MNATAAKETEAEAAVFDRARVIAGEAFALQCDGDETSKESILRLAHRIAELENKLNETGEN